MCQATHVKPEPGTTPPLPHDAAPSAAAAPVFPRATRDPGIFREISLALVATRDPVPRKGRLMRHPRTVINER